MRLAALLSAVFSVAFLAGCSTGGQPTAAVTPTKAVQSPSSIATPVSSPLSIPSPSQPPLVIPAPTTPFVRCDTPDLEMRLTSEGAAAGNITATIEVRNKSQHDCDLYGYAGLQLLDARGRPLPTHVTWSTTSFFLEGTAVEAVVGLPAGTPAISTAIVDPQHPIRPVPGHAYIPLSWNDVVGACSNAAKLKVTPPDASQSLVISAAPSGGLPPLMWVCSGGTVYVNPTRVAVRL